jgi:hypothetical protein
MTAPTAARPSRPVTLRPATTTAAGGRRIAKIALRDELDEYRAALTGAMVRTADGDTGRFLAHHDRAAGRFAAARGSAASERDQSVPVLTVVVSELRRLVLAAT